MTTPDAHPHPGRKRIIVCCDGTWMNSDGIAQVPSNVTRIGRALKHHGIDENGQPVPQIIFYQNGVGTGINSLWAKYFGGATGEGLAEHIREAYGFICLNYNPGDEIFLIGFSRGAFTARSISSLIRAVGLLTSAGLEFFEDIFEDWQYQLKGGWKPKRPSLPWPGHGPPVSASEYQRQLRHLNLTRPDITIKAVAVWETVGGLGIPMIALLPQPPSHDFAFVDTKVEPNIEYAFQALALDEHRRSYTPTIWEKPAGQDLPRLLKQCWFPGVHSDIGGSYPDTDLANVTLCWMVNQLEPLLSFDHDYIRKQVHLSIEKEEKDFPNKAARPWGLGKIHNSFTPFFLLGGSLTRTPDEYCQTTPSSTTQHGTLWWMMCKLMLLVARKLNLYREPVMPRLEGTNETVHSSVRIRMGKEGLGYDDMGSYDSQALKGWVFHGVETQPDTPVQQSLPGAPGKMKNVVWKKKLTQPSPNDKLQDQEDEVLEMPEDEMGPFEREILRLWPETDATFDSIRPGAHKQSIIRVSTFPTLEHSPENGTTAGSAGADAPLRVVTNDNVENRPPERVVTI